MMNLVFKNIEDFKMYLSSSKNSDFSLDFSESNMFECLQILIPSSAYFFHKYPEDKLKCKLPSEDVRELISTFNVKNIEFV